MKPKRKPVPARRLKKLAAFRLPPASLARLREMADRHNLSQARILESLIHTATL